MHDGTPVRPGDIVCGTPAAAAYSQCLVSLAGVRDAAVCAVATAGADELVAVLATTSPLDVHSVNAALAQNGIEATVDRIVIVERIPRNATGKVSRNDLRQLASSA